jgi:hypothetical protein
MNAGALDAVTQRGRASLLERLKARRASDRWSGPSIWLPKLIEGQGVTATKDMRPKLVMTKHWRQIRQRAPLLRQKETRLSDSLFSQEAVCSSHI